MKTLLISLIASLTAVSTLQAHCGTCSMDEMEGGHGDHAKCYSGTLDKYFAIQQALAGDDLSAAQTAASKLETGLAESKCSIDGKDCCVEVSGSAASIAKAKDIAAARAAFQALSKTVLAQVKEHSPEQTVYAMYCPMAFNNKGGAWLQNNKDLRNPYFGASMLKCGTTQAEYGHER